MADYSDEELYDMLKKVLHGTKKFLCQVFERRWRKETGKDWKKLSISEKISILGRRAFHTANCIELVARSPVNLEDCELSLLSSAILSFPQVEKYNRENDAVTAIKNLSESLAPKYSGKLSSHDYIRETDKVRNSLKCLGVKNKKIDDLIFELKQDRPDNAGRHIILVNGREEISLASLLESLLHNRSVGIPGEDLFQKGMKHLSLIFKGQSNNWAKVASCFRQAEKKSHVDAIFLLGVCYKRDYYSRVREDLDKATKLIEKAARMDAKSPGAFTLYKCNTSVAQAQASLGSMYFIGQIRKNVNEGAVFTQEGDHGDTMDKTVDTSEDSKHAAVWFEKAMENGNGLAARNMAFLYTWGNGVVRHNCMARMCFKESINLKYAGALVPLSEHYLRSLEPEKATHIGKMAIGKASTISLQEKQKQFDAAMTSARNTRKRWERQVENFESEYGLDIKGLTFRQRLMRLKNYSSLFTMTYNVIKENLFSAHTFHCFGTAVFIEGDPMLGICPYQQLFQLVEEKQELTESENLQVLEWTYQILIQGPRLVPMRELTGKGIGKILESLQQEEVYKEQSELDEKLRLCCAAFNLFLNCNETTSMQMLVKGTQRYPENNTYRTFLCLYLGKKENWTWGLRTAEEGLKEDPKNVELMYLEAVFFSFLHFDTQFEECVAKYKNILDSVLDNDPIVPDACYAISALYVQKVEHEMKPTDRFRHMDTKLMNYYYERGLEAEAVQLDWFLPYRASSIKIKVGMTYLSCVRDTETGAEILKNIRTFKGEHTVLEGKMYLRSPTRKGLIKLHRQIINDKKADNMAVGRVRPSKYEAIDDLPKFQQTLSEGLTSLKPITLLEMNPMEEQIYEDRLIELIILVEPDFNSGFFASVTEDKDGDVIRLHVYNFQEEENIAGKFSVGSRIAVMNPYLSLTKWDLHSCIRIDDLRSVIFQRKVRNMCGFCGEEDSSHACSKCQRIYCSKECGDLDVKRHGHKLVCS